MVKKRYVIAIMVIGVLTACVLGVFKGTLAKALFDESEAVHINAAEIEDATLLVGTHLIHISAVNDEIYEIAADSAAESNQQRRYYKSELADGSWFDISDADSLKSITSEGEPVEDEVIEGLFLTHHTRSDGVTYDLRTNQAVCMFDILNPYDLAAMKELEALKIPYDMLADKEEKSEDEEENEGKVREFFQMGGTLKGSETDELDAQIRALQDYSVSADDSERAEALHTMAALDAARRKIVLEGVRDGLNDLIERLQEGGEALNGDLNSGASDSLEAVEASILACEAKSLSEGTTVLGREEYAVRTEMARTAQAGDRAACDAAAKKAVLLEAIKADQIGDAKKELAYLNETLLLEAQKVYSDLLNGGAGEEYRAKEAKSNTSKGVLNKALKDRLNETEAAKAELQYLINAALERMTQKQGSSFLSRLVTEAETMKNGILDDAFAAYADSSIEAYTAYLNDLSAQKNPTENGNALSELLEQKKEKQEEKQTALDNNDLAGAKRADAELEELNRRADELERQMSKNGEVLAGEGGTTPQTALASANQLAKAAVETIQDGSVSGVAEAIDGLGALIGVNPDAALDGLKDIYKALATEAYLVAEVDEKANGFEECMTKIEDCIAENGQTLNDSSTTEEEAKELLEEAAGKELSEASDKEQAALLKASLDSLEQEANEGIRKMAQLLASQMEADGNPYIFRQYNDPINEYIPAKTISECLRYRYVFENQQQTVTLSKKGSYYTFCSFGTGYETGDEEQKDMKMNAGFQGDIYISEQDAQEIFKCTAQYIPGSDLALLLTEDNKDQASAYLSMLLTRLGG